MNEILLNMANHLLIEYCRAKNIDCSGTYCAKAGRATTKGFSYELRKQRPEDVRFPAVARITFHKNQTPTYGRN